MVSSPGRNSLFGMSSQDSSTPRLRSRLAASPEHPEGTAGETIMLTHLISMGRKYSGAYYDPETRQFWMYDEGWYKHA